MRLLLGTLGALFAYLAWDAWRFTISRRQESEIVERAIVLEKSSSTSLEAKHRNLIAHRMYGIRSTYTLPWLFGLIAVALAVATIWDQ